MSSDTIWAHVNELYRGGKAYIARFASVVFDAYQEGDSHAIQIIDQNTQRLAELLNTGVKLYGASPIANASGGLFQHYSDIMLPHMAQHTAVKLLVSDLPPIYGACRKACMLADRQTSDSFQQNFNKSYQEKKGEL